MGVGGWLGGGAVVSSLVTSIPPKQQHQQQQQQQKHYDRMSINTLCQHYNMHHKETGEMALEDFGLFEVRSQMTLILHAFS